jgi:hypothetical protein
MVLAQDQLTWEDVEPGFVLNDRVHLWLVTRISTRADDPAHEFLVVRMEGLTNDKGGLELLTQGDRRLNQSEWSVECRPA